MELQRVINCFRENGIVWTIDRTLSFIQERIFDLRYGVDTAETCPYLEPFTIESLHRHEGVGYEPTRMRPFRKLMSRLTPPPNSVFVDMGCGKGRVLMLAAAYGFERIIGVEFAKELVQIASDNVARFRKKSGTRSDIQVIEQDAVEYRVQDDDNFFFMFNPFAALVMEIVIRNIAESVARKNRQVFIIYNNPLWRGVIEQHGFSLLRESDAGKILVYSNL
jgi:SAM-dependent methyltransferase